MQQLIMVLVHMNVSVTMFTILYVLTTSKLVNILHLIMHVKPLVIKHMLFGMEIALINQFMDVRM